jgi:hypothetical protein
VTRRRFLAFATATVALALVVAGAVLLAADLDVHRRGAVSRPHLPRLSRTGRRPETGRRDSNRRTLADMMDRQFSNDACVLYLDLSGAVDLSDRNDSFDEMHLGLDANRAIAAALVDPVRAIIGALASR